MAKSKSNFFVWLLIVVLLPFIAVVKALHPPAPFVNPHMKAPSFAAPPGCLNMTYKKWDKISATCADKNNFLGTATGYGFPQRSKGAPEYYRVGNDAIDIMCGGLVWSNNDCEVRNVVRDVFSS